MPAVYAQPAAANYFSAPSHPIPKQRGHRVCDKCGAIEQSHNRFRLCSGCMTTQYCSPECQKAHWQSHKAICQHTASQISSAKQQPSFGSVDEHLVKSLRKFVSAQSQLLSWAGFQALQLKRVPANIRQFALLVELSYCPSATDSIRKFSIKSSHVVPRTYVTDNDPLVGEEIRRRDDCSRKSGGIGCAVILVQCGEISQVMPVDVDSPSRISWDMRDDWSETLRHFVDSGRADFKPISTTARGIVFG